MKITKYNSSLDPIVQDELCYDGLLKLTKNTSGINMYI